MRHFGISSSRVHHVSIPAQSIARVEPVAVDVKESAAIKFVAWFLLWAAVMLGIFLVSIELLFDQPIGP